MRRGAILLLVGMLLVAGAMWAAADGSNDLSWHTVAGGGGTLAGDGFTMEVTAGQAAAGVMAGGGYALASGFSAGGIVAPPPGHVIYLPLVMRNW
jgi:hypothetical protein